MILAANTKKMKAKTTTLIPATTNGRWKAEIACLSSQNHDGASAVKRLKYQQLDHLADG
jgi:hypothetical protein